MAITKDTYKATSLTFILLGALYLIDITLGFKHINASWIMNKDNMVLYTSIIFLLFKKDKSVGLTLIALWLIMNIGMISSFVGNYSTYILPVSLLAMGLILYFTSARK